jgi:hypothetical protein
MIVSDNEYLDFSRVPQSRGVPHAILYAIAIGLVMIFAIGGSCVLLSGYGHKWPATSTMRVNLGPNHQ